MEVTATCWLVQWTLKALVNQRQSACVHFYKKPNDAVRAKFVEESPEVLHETNHVFCSQFSLTIATQLSENVVSKLDRICRQQNEILVIKCTYGLTGLV